MANDSTVESVVERVASGSMGEVGGGARAAVRPARGGALDRDRGGGLARAGVQGLLAEWEALEPKDAEAWAQELTYFTNQSGRMRYDEYLRTRLPIGSGAIESANRHVVGVRVKQAG